MVYRKCISKNDVIILFTVWEESMDVVFGAQLSPFVPVLINSNEIWKNNEMHLKQARQLLHSIYDKYLKKFHVINLLISNNTKNKENIGTVIVDTAHQFEVDYVVVGSRGLGAVRQFFMGSVSKYVVEHTKCPVLVIKENQ